MIRAWRILKFKFIWYQFNQSKSTDIQTINVLWVKKKIKENSLYKELIILNNINKKNIGLRMRKLAIHDVLVLFFALTFPNKKSILNWTWEMEKCRNKQIHFRCFSYTELHTLIQSANEFSQNEWTLLRTPKAFAISIGMSACKIVIR